MREPYISRKALVYHHLTEFEKLFIATPQGTEFGDPINQKFVALKESIQNLFSKNEETYNRVGQSNKSISASKRESEIFFLELREGGRKTIVGWDDLISALNIREGYARVLFSTGKGSFTRLVGYDHVTVDRPGAFATPEELRKYREERQKMRRPKRTTVSVRPLGVDSEHA